MLNDLRYGFRTLLQTPAWTFVIVLSLALGIGANTAIFITANGLLIRKLSVQDPDSLVRLRWTGRNDAVSAHLEYGALPEGVWAAFSYPVVRELAAHNESLTGLAAGAPLNDVSVVVEGRAEAARGFVATGNYHRLLGVTTHLGRTLTPGDDAPGAPGAAVVSYQYWRRRFGGDSSVLGTTIRVNNVPLTVVGVLPASFTGVQRPVGEDFDVTVPLALYPRLRPEPDRLAQAGDWWLHVLGRLKPGTTAGQVEGNLGPVFQHIVSAHSASPSGSAQPTTGRERSRAPELVVDSASRGLYESRADERRSTTILGAVVLLVLLLVCANVANLLLSRAAARQKDLSVRLSLGATRGRLLRQLLMESVLLAVMGGGFGLIVASWGMQLLPEPAPPWDWRVFAFVAALSVTTGIVFGIAPALRASRVNVSAALKDTSRAVIVSRTRLARLLLVAQVALSVVLVAGAGVLLRTVGNLRAVDVGFTPENLLVLGVTPAASGADEAQRQRRYDEILRSLESVPGVQGAALSAPALLSGGVWTTQVYPHGRAPAADSGHHVHVLTISEGFFDVMQIPLLAGRRFSASDRADTPKVVVINAAAARALFPDGSPLGRRFGYIPGAASADTIEVVGLVENVRYNSLRDAPPPTIYVPHAQRAPDSAVFNVRTAGAPAASTDAVRGAVARVDPTLPVAWVVTQRDLIERRFGDERLFARMCLLFGALSVLIAAMGIFGLMSYSVASRTNEIGIRMALGARGEDVRRLVLQESMRPVLAGIVIGIVATIAAGRFITSLLYGVTPADPISIATATATLVIVSAAAGYLPARRASRVDPLVALRYE